VFGKRITSPPKEDDPCWVGGASEGSTRSLCPAWDQLYWAVGWLGERLEQDSRWPSASAYGSRTRKDMIEEELLCALAILASARGLVFFDTFPIYFEGKGSESLASHGHSEDHWPELRQMAVGVVPDHAGYPTLYRKVGRQYDRCEKTRSSGGVPEEPLPRGEVVHRAQVAVIRERRRARRFEHAAALFSGVRMRRSKEANEVVLSRTGRYEELCPKSADPKRLHP
jgi:hypothetical protein